MDCIDQNGESIFNNKNIKLSSNYRIKKFLEYGNKIDIVFE